DASLMVHLIWPFVCLRSLKLLSLRGRYEKAGLSVADEPIPWNADAVLVEAVIRHPAHPVPRKDEFQLRTPDRIPRLPIALQPAEEGAVRVTFRLPPIQCQTSAAVYCGANLLGQILLPFLPAAVFLRNLGVRSPTVFAFLGASNVACQTLVEGQCHGLSAGGILASPTSLLPISDFNLRAEFTGPNN